MEKKLQNYLDYFKQYTMEMIFNLKNDDIDNFQLTLEKRTQIIEKINELSFDSNNFKVICEELDIVSINNELSKIVTDKRDELKEKIMKLKRSESANNAYQSILRGSNIFSKKV